MYYDVGLSAFYDYLIHVQQRVKREITLTLAPGSLKLRSDFLFVLFLTKPVPVQPLAFILFFENPLRI